IRWPMAEPRGFLDLEFDHARGIAATVLMRRLTDHVDEFGLVGHGTLPAKRLAQAALCAQVVNGSLPEFVHVETSQSQRHSRTSTKCPAMAAAAAIAGETRCVRPLKPCRPSKLRFDVEAQRSSGASLSGFIARHIEQPGSRHSKPALIKILSRPSASACSFTMPEPGTIMALTLLFTVLPSAILAAARRSSMRPLVQEPMKTRSSLMSVILVPADSPIYFSARCFESRFASSSIL